MRNPADLGTEKEATTGAIWSGGTIVARRSRNLRGRPSTSLLAGRFFGGRLDRFGIGILIQFCLKIAIFKVRPGPFQTIANVVAKRCKSIGWTLK